MLKEKNYIFSKYVFIFNYTKNLSIIYSTKTGGLCIIENCKLNDIINNYEPDYTLVNELIKQKMLVDSSIDETKEIIALQKRKINTDKIYKVAIVPTYMCNFSCDYCFVSEKDGLLSEEEINRIIQFLIKQVKKFDFKELYLDWFGGEPLLAKNKIKIFMKMLQDILHIKINSTLVTNGYLLTREVVEDLGKLNITTFQITFDGNKNSHNKYRRGKNDHNTYERIMKNIEEITRSNISFKLDIRCNMNKNNKNEVIEFILDISKKFKDDPRVNINLKPIINFSNKKESFAFDGYGEVANYRNEVIVNLLKKNLNYGLSLPKPKFWWCNAGFDSNINIGPGCKIYACRSEFGNPNKTIGLIDENGNAKYNYRLSQWQDKDLIINNEKCLDCNMLPICMGSCKVLRFTQNKNLCYWDRESLEQYVKMWVDINFGIV